MSAIDCALPVLFSRISIHSAHTGAHVEEVST
jgi:hypothetical protein